MQKAIRLLIPIGVLILGWIGHGMLSKQEEKPARPIPPQRIIKTRIIDLQKQDYQTVVETQGVVRAHNEASLTAQVAGKVKAIAPDLQDGAFFEKDDVLVELETEDLAAGIVTAEAELARAKAAYAQEQARANQAKLNWEDLGYTDEPNELVLRLPQLREAQANVDAAQASVQRAKRDLERAVVRAPFDGRVLQRTVAVGQSISSASVLATIFDTSFVEVRLPVAGRQLETLTLPESQDDPPVDVTFTDALDDVEPAQWSGQIVGTEGSLDSSSRELFAIARVSDPFGREPGAEDHPPLRIGQPVRAAIKGKVLPGVFVIPRSAVRRLNRIALVVNDEEDPEKLILKRFVIEPIWSGLENLVVRNPDIPDPSQLATTRLAYLPEGTPVEVLPGIEATNEEEIEQPGGS